MRDERATRNPVQSLADQLLLARDGLRLLLFYFLISAIARVPTIDLNLPQTFERLGSWGLSFCVVAGFSSLAGAIGNCTEMPDNFRLTDRRRLVAGINLARRLAQVAALACLCQLLTTYQIQIALPMMLMLLLTVAFFFPFLCEITITFDVLSDYRDRMRLCQRLVMAALLVALAGFLIELWTPITTQTETLLVSSIAVAACQHLLAQLCGLLRRNLTFANYVQGRNSSDIFGSP